MRKAVQAEKGVKVDAIREFQANINGGLSTLLDTSLVFTKKFCEDWNGKLEIITTGINEYVETVKQNAEHFGSFLI